MLLVMSSEPRKVVWTEEETIDQAVRRLIGVMDERKERRASGAQSTEKFADPSRTSPCVPKENGGQSPSANSVGSAALKGSGRQSTVAGGGGDGCEYGGRAARVGSEPISFEANGRTRPVTPDEAVGGDRARNRHSGGFE